MLKAIVVFPEGKHWIEVQQLFEILSFMGVTIKGQDGFGSSAYECKDDYLIIDGTLAEWKSGSEFKQLMQEQWVDCFNFDNLCYSIRGIDKYHA